MDKGYMFIWDPREQVPYLVPPSVVPNCKLRIPRKHRICASRGPRAQQAPEVGV